MPHRAFSSNDYWDTLVALAVRFGDPESTATANVGTALSCFDDSRRATILGRCELLDNAVTEDRLAWSETISARVVRKPATELDPNVNPSHIVDILANESPAVRKVILDALPADLSRRIALYLDLRFTPPDHPEDDENGLRTFVFRQFVGRFTAFGDLAAPDELDRFNVDEMESFTRHLGLREIAIACRGIATKETLAAFLNRFDADDAREIVSYVTELDKIRPFWVAQADALVRKSWNAELPPATVVRKIGLKILAAGFILRDEQQLSYAAQKMPLREVNGWQRTVRASRRRYFAASDDDRPRLDKRRRIVERLAVKFKQTGRL